jgi:hypothetical protein
MSTKTVIKVKDTFPAADAARLKKIMSARKWNALKAGVFMDVSPSVIESALNGATMRIVSIEKLKLFIKEGVKNYPLK